MNGIHRRRVSAVATRRAAAAITAVALCASTAALAAGSRIYEGASVWYAVSHGAVVFSQFYADGPDHARSYGADIDAQGVFNKVRQIGPAAVARFGVQVKPADGANACAEEKTQNAVGADGWAFSCTFPIELTGAAPAMARATPVNLPEPAPARPAAAPKATAPAPAKALSAPVQTATAGPPAAAPPPKVMASTAPSPPGDETAMLNAKITAANKAVDERNHAAQAQFEAQQAAYEAQKKSYEAQVVAQKAEAEALTRKHAQEVTAWEAKVRACKAGDTSQCAQ